MSKSYRFMNNFFIIILTVDFEIEKQKKRMFKIRQFN